MEIYDLENTQDGAHVYDIYRGKNLILRAARNGAKKRYKLSDYEWNNLTKGKEVKGKKAIEHGIINHIYLYRGFYGTKDELAKILGIKIESVRYVISTGKAIKASYFIEEDIEPIVKESTVIKKAPKTKRVIQYDSPNKAYMEYLFKSTVGGWRK